MASKSIDSDKGKKGLVRTLLGETVTAKYPATENELKGKLTFGYRVNKKFVEIDPYDFVSQGGTNYPCYRLMIGLVALPINLKDINLEKSSIEKRLVVIGGSRK